MSIAKAWVKSTFPIIARPLKNNNIIHEMDTGCSEHVGSYHDARRMPCRNNWMISSDEALVDLLLDESAQSSSCPGSFRPEAWLRIWNLYQKITKEDTTLLQLKGRWKTLKKLYKLHASLLAKSGWSWDLDTQRPIPGSPTVWEEIIKLNKEYKVFREKPFPLYPKIHDIVASSTATAQYARHTGATVRGDDFALTWTRALVCQTVLCARGHESFFHQCLVGVLRGEPSRFVSKKKSSDHTLDTANRLSDRRSRILEQSKEEADIFSFKTCMDKLSGMPGLSDLEIVVAAKALKSPEERIFFMMMRQSTIDFRLSELMKEYHGQRPDQSNK